MLSYEEITKNASKEYYIAFLFDAIEKGVVISLMYSWTPLREKYPYKKALSQSKKVSREIKNKIEKEFDINFFDSENKEVGFSERPRGYQAGTIISKNVPYNKLSNFDFQKTISLLDTYYKYLYNNILGGYKMEDFIQKIDKNENFDKALEETSKDYFKLLDPEKITSLNGFDITKSASCNKRNSFPIARESHKIIRANQNKIGDQGEKIVEIYENKNLKNTKYKARILNTDGDGYDVLSFNKNGDEKYIEVKSVKSKPNNILSFYITQNELDKAKELDNYYLYIVIGVGTLTPEIIEYKKPFGNVKKEVYSEFKLSAEKYKVTIDISKKIYI